MYGSVDIGAVGRSSSSSSSRGSIIVVVPGLLAGALLAADDRSRRVERKFRTEFACRSARRGLGRGHGLLPRGFAPALLSLGVGLQFISFPFVRFLFFRSKKEDNMKI